MQIGEKEIKGQIYWLIGFIATSNTWQLWADRIKGRKEEWQRQCLDSTQRSWLRRAKKGGKIGVGCEENHRGEDDEMGLVADQP